MTLSELEDYFNSATLPHELELNRSTRIVGVKKCVASYIAVARQYEGKPIADVFIDHLMQIKVALDGDKVPEQT